MVAAISIDRPAAARTRAAISIVLAALMALTMAPAVGAAAERINVIITGRSAGEAVELTERVGGTVSHVLPIIDGAAASIPAPALTWLQGRAYVVPDRDVEMTGASYGGTVTTAYPHEVGAVELWNAGRTGRGVTVALVDTGVANVPDLAGRVVASANLSGEDADEDTYGHGTFQAGLIAGNGTSSGGAYVGVAPEANLLSVKVAGADGSTSLGQVLAGVQLVDSAATRFNVKVLLLAVDSESPLPPDLDPLSWALRSVWSHGVTVVVPAGNNGNEPGSIASPGSDPWLLTVGSVDDQGTPDVSDDTVAPTSGVGPTIWGDEKPEVAAPGEHLVSVRAPGSTVDEQNPTARVAGGYFKGSGTSMSAAVTAGAAALLLQARPGLSPDEVKALLQATAEPIPTGTADTVGAGVVDAADAAAFAGDLPALPSLPDLGPATAPFTPPGHGYDWRQDEQGVWRWDALRGPGTTGDGNGNADFEARRWNARRWADVEWIARRWDDADWGARQWAARQWAARRWNARQWAARRWNARRWAEGSWEARRWNADSFEARQWAARQWAARQWSADEWEARQWSARQWNARQWSMDDWQARRWSARQWDARQWSARQWDARQWDARQWSARQWSSQDWSARQWSARRWTSASWG